MYYDRRRMDALKLEAHRTTLLVVDVQEKLLPAMPPAHQRRLIAAHELLLEAARLLKVHTIATEQYPRGLGATAAPVRAMLDTFDWCAVPVFEKTVFSAAAVHGVTDALSLVDARTVIVTGMETHVCVFQTVRDLLHKGFHVHVPFDAVASRDPECRRVALETLRGCGAKITSSESVVFDLLKDAKHPEFRAISARVKALPIEA
jgi:nicotinamidase-related amidase